jgi:hypothetical protein
MEVCSSVNDMHENCISNLESTFSKSLHIQDTEKSEHLSEGDAMCNVAKENSSGVKKQKESKPNMVCLKKSATFPIPHATLPSSSSDEDADSSVIESPHEHSAHQAYSRSISLPVSFSCYKVGVNDAYVYWFQAIMLLNFCFEKAGVIPYVVLICWSIDAVHLLSIPIEFTYSI